MTTQSASALQSSFLIYCLYLALVRTLKYRLG
jgi:hypothetical protein